MTNAPTPKVRFDNMRDRTSSLLLGYEGELRAEKLDDVVGVLEGAEEAAHRGLWAAGFVSYDAAPAFDSGLAVSSRFDVSRPNTPLAWFGLYRECAVTPLRLPRGNGSLARATWRPMIEEAEYVAHVSTILHEITEGNVYQVNFTNAVVASQQVDARSLYRQLLIAQQPAYGALVELDGLAVASSSPELFIEWDGEALRSRPMKGTSRRGRWAEEDGELAHQLATSPKETAENVMIVDLIRNDMGKVARVGTVQVAELREVEAYPNVWQLVSEVHCETRDDVKLVDVFAAMFPCGSVTGAPKQSAMSIIASLEVAERGVYCGAIGQIAPRSSGVRAQFSVAIRTATVTSSGVARFGSGGGIVADSRPATEYREMVLKSDVLRAAAARPFRLLETFRHVPGQPSENLARHLDRLRRSAAFFGFAARPDLEAWVARRLRDVEYEARVRLLLARGGRLELRVEPAPMPRKEPLRVAIDGEPMSSASMMLFHKTTRREPYRRRQRRFPQADDVVMVNERGECTEATTANLAARFGSVWRTPPLSAGCLPGVERARLIERGVLVEAALRPEELRRADGLALVNSLRGWQDAQLLTDQP